MKDIRKIIAENKTCNKIHDSYLKYVKYINFPTNHSKWVLVIYIVVALSAFFISVNGRYTQYESWKENKEQFFYNDTPMMTTLDAYKYIRHAKEINNNEYIPGGNDVKIFYPEGVPFYDPAPLLSVMLAKLHNILGYDYYNIAINMVPWLSSIFILALCAYFYIAGFPALGVTAGLLTTFAPVYLSRTSIGRFDTDGGNMFFLFTASLFILLASKAKKEHFIYIFSALLGLTILAFAHFYNHILFNLVYFLIFIFSLFIYNKKYKTILIASLIYIITSNPLYFAMSLNSLIGSLAVYIPFLPNNLESASPIPWVYNTISEAAAEPFMGIVAFTIKNPILFVIGLISALLFFAANIKKAFPLIPIFAMGFVVFISSGRFAMFLMPFIALGLGYMIYIISHYIIKYFGKNLEKRIDFTKAIMPLVLSFFMLSILFGSNMTAYGIVPAPSIDTTIYKDISELKNTLPKDSTIYTWWDYGLAITDITEFPVYHSGMSQSTPKTWMIAKSFTSDMNTFYNIASYIEQGGYDKTMAMFDNNTSLDIVEKTMEEFNLGPINENNYILFTFDMVQKYGALAYLSQKEDAIIPMQCINSGENKLYLCSNGQIIVDAAAGLIAPRDAKEEDIMPLNTIIATKKGYKLYEQSFHNMPPYSAVINENDDTVFIFLMPNNTLRSAFTELFLAGEYDEKLFTIVYDNYPFSRVYKLNKK